MRAPKFGVGDIIHISSNSVPYAYDVIVEMVYMKGKNRVWMYRVISEMTGMPAYMPESELSNKMSRHLSKIYKKEEVIQRIKDGYRFCGNYDTEQAIRRGKKCTLENINAESVMLYPALDAYGEPIADKYGLWVKWFATLPQYMNDDSKLPVEQEYYTVGEPIKIK